MHQGNYFKRNDLEEYLNNNFNIKIYEELTESIRFKDLFEPLAFFNLLDQQYHIVIHNREKPISVAEHITKLDLNEKQLHFLLLQLLKLLKKERRKKTDRSYSQLEEEIGHCIKFLDKEFKRLDAIHFPKETVKNTESRPAAPYKYDFDQVRLHINTHGDEKDKIKYLLDMKSQYMQDFASMDYSDHVFVIQSDVEIQKIKDHLELDQVAGIQSRLPQFKLSDKKGAKIDLIRILNALYELQLITEPNDQIPSKLAFFESFGDFLGIDLKAYHASLSQSLNNQHLEVNLKVFDDMKKITQDNHYSSK